MNLIRIAGLVAVIAVTSQGQTSPEEFNIRVERVRLLRNERGDLHIDVRGATFRSSDGKTTISIPMGDLREADVADPRSLRFQRYEVKKWEPMERCDYEFRAAGEDVPVEALAQFLTSRIDRPVIGHYTAASKFRIPAFHRRTRGGTHGTLEFGDDAIRFVSDNPVDSRSWSYRDIETIGQPDWYRFRVTTNRETYVLELKSRLQTTAYEFAWSKVYNLERSSR